MDIGCGDGLLLQRLAPHVRQAVGIDPDEGMISRARTRLADAPQVSLVAGDFLAMPVPPREERYDTIVCVATLHHMELSSALRRMAEALAPGGRLLIVGLAADKSLLDMTVSGLLLLPIRVMDRLHGGMRDPGVRMAEPKESIADVRRAARDVLPGAVLRRRFYFRYVLTWDKPREERLR
ncbi:class I SAM-dependent methyltransferase [Paenibacillus sp.]|uniref:class I SAM-dependent methyltransferase n=1 Tax=Paenibacillus sp. TaxID=58172 RepID=UPI002D780A8B|nr:class I SAM-dependent methyltransferase [Paenibacillus sp.]